MNPPFFTARGDDGSTGLLGEGRIAKDDPRMETIGAVDEAGAAIGVARSLCAAAETPTLLLQVQRDLYGLMGEVAATPENASRFRVIDSVRVTWLEEQIRRLGQTVIMPREFIVPGDTQSGAFLDLARTITRRAERRMVALFHTHQLENKALLGYLNRLSSLLFLLELVEAQHAGHGRLTLAKEE